MLLDKVNQPDDELWHYYSTHANTTVHLCKGIALTGDAMLSLREDVWLDAKVVLSLLIMTGLPTHLFFSLEDVNNVLLGTQFLSLTVYFTHLILMIN